MADQLPKSDHDLLIEVCRDVKNIRENELEHMRTDIREVRGWIIGVFITVVVGIIGLIIERLVG